MGLFSNPLGHAGYPPGVTGTPSTQPASVRAATAAEAAAGVLDNVYLTPKTDPTALASDFASPPVLGFGSTIPRPVNATSLSASGPIGLFGAPQIGQQLQGAIVNNVSASGITGTIANFSNLTTYSADAPTIKADIYQLALGLQGCIAALRKYGLLA